MLIDNSAYITHIAIVINNVELKNKKNREFYQLFDQHYTFWCFCACKLHLFC